MKRKWWENIVAYNIYPLSFMDANNDGYGDIEGVIQKLDYLKELGIELIWLCPIFKTDFKDNGYDVIDYFKIDGKFGTNEMFDTLLKEANKRNIKVIIDLVLNHCSNKNEWFIKALNGDEEYEKYFYIQETANGYLPNNWRSKFGGPAWIRIENTNKYYLGTYSKFQPDLNWENPKLREELYNIANFWLKKGVNGFRLDAIHNLKKNFSNSAFPIDGEDGLAEMQNYNMNNDGIEKFFQEFKQKVVNGKDIFIVAEALIQPEKLDIYIGENGFANSAFNFEYVNIDLNENENWFKPIKFSIEDFRDTLFGVIKQYEKLGLNAPYFESLDQPRFINKFFSSKEINFFNTTLMANLLLTLPGIPFIYQGQEIGMQNISINEIEKFNDISTLNNFQRAINNGISKKEALDLVNKRSRDNARTPMQWTYEPYAGFSKTKPWFLVNENFSEINVKQQQAEKISVLKHYQKLIEVRSKNKNSCVSKNLFDGNFKEEFLNVPDIIAFTRKNDCCEILVLNNFSDKSVELKLEKKYSDIVVSNYKEYSFQENKYILQPFEGCILKRNCINE